MKNSGKSPEDLLSASVKTPYKLKMGSKQFAVPFKTPDFTFRRIAHFLRWMEFEIKGRKRVKKETFCCEEVRRALHSPEDKL